jgi:hypothetical protein
MPVNFVVDRPFSRGFWRGKNRDGHKVKFRVPRLSGLNVLFYYEKGPCLCSMSRSFSLSLEGPAVLEDLQYGLDLKKTNRSASIKSMGYIRLQSPAPTTTTYISGFGPSYYRRIEGPMRIEKKRVELHSPWKPSPPKENVNILSKKKKRLIWITPKHYVCKGEIRKLKHRREKILCSDP